MIRLFYETITGMFHFPAGIGKCLIVCSTICGTTAQGQSLEEFLEWTRSNNPEIKAGEWQYAIALEKAEEANTLPDTEFGAGWFASETETRTGPQKARFSVRQMLPWFGTITAREAYAESMAEASQETLALSHRTLSLEVSRTYYALLALTSEKAVVSQNIDLLDLYEQQAITRVEVGKASLVDVLQIQIRRGEMQQELEVLGEQEKALKATLNALVNRNPATEIVVTDSLSFPDTDVIPDTTRLRGHPELLRYDKLYEGVAREEMLNQKERAPNLGLGLDYVPVQERTDMAFDDNGKDVIMPMVSLTVPVFNSSYKSQTRQNRMKQEEILARQSDRTNRLRARLQEAITERNVARIQYETQEQNLVKARNAEEILLKQYQTGNLDFKQVLDILDLRLELRMKQIGALEKYLNQTALIHYLAGES